MQLYYEAFRQYAEFSSDKLVEFKHKFYSFLINIQLSDKWLEKCETEILPRIFTKLDAYDYWELPLVLVVSKSLPLISAYNTYLRTRYENDPFNRQNAFLMAVERSTHFLEPVIAVNGIQEFPVPDCLADVSRLVHLTLLISNKPTRPPKDFDFYEEVWKQFKEINLANLNESQRIFYYELARVLNLHDFVRSNWRYAHVVDTIAIKVLCSKYNILDFFVKFNDGTLIINTTDYACVRRQLVENGVFNGAINPAIEKNADRPSEVHIYDQFYTINLMVDVLLIRPMTRNYEEIMHAKSAEIKKIIDNIDDPLAYIELVEYLFMLMFLRWEHVSSRCLSNNKLDEPTSDASSASQSDSTYESSDDPRSHRSKKNGFVCTFTVLKLMLDVLSSSLANRKIDHLNDELKKRFNDISTSIADAEWRLHLVDLYYIAMNWTRASSDLKVMLTSHVKAWREKVCSSSEDGQNADASSRQHAVIRRKPRRRLRKMDKTKNNDTNTHSNATKSSFDSEATAVMVQHDDQRDWRKGFMSKMLGQLTDMVTTAVIRGDLDTAKSIIQVIYLVLLILLTEIFESIESKLKSGP